MKLYYSRGACSMAPHIALYESGLSFSIESVNLVTGLYSNGNFKELNPKGYVPVLELDNGEILTEGAVIMQYIADKAPDKNLIPKTGTMERYTCQEWLNYIATEIHKGFSPLWNEANPDSVMAATKEDLAKKFDFLTTRLSGKTFLMGEQYTVADSYLFTILNWSRFLKLDMSKWPVLLGYIEKISARPATQSVIAAEGIKK